MEMTSTLSTLRSELRDELTLRILPYWMEHAIDHVHGGFVGRITQNNEVVAGAEKGVVLNARILWTFSAAHRSLGGDRYRAVADRAYEYLTTSFRDDEQGGFYWMLAHDGCPADDRKHVYAQAFVLYGLTEYYRASGHEPALDEAIHLFDRIEQYAHDLDHGGYHEAFDRYWLLLEDVRLSAKDEHERKSMNTHLHVLEAYANLYRVWPDAGLRAQLQGLTEVFITRILQAETKHFLLFFDEDWRPKSSTVSYGHDIEASWLLLDAADVLGDDDLRQRVREVSIDIARVTLAEGVDDDGGLFNEGGPAGIIDTDKDWWPQAEAIVGFLRAYEETGEGRFAGAAQASWDFIKRFVVDEEHGEWFGRVARDGVPREGEDKVGPWKCPYHNARACLEAIGRMR